MHNLLILQGVVVSISDPLQEGGSGKLKCIITLDATDTTNGRVNTIPVEFFEKRAVAVKRDIVPGDTVTIQAVPVERDGIPRDHILGMEVKVAKGINIGFATGMLVADIEPPRTYLHAGKTGEKTIIEISRGSRSRNAQSLRFEVYGSLAVSYQQRFRKGMWLSVTYRLQTFRYNSRLYTRLVATHVEELS